MLLEHAYPSIQYRTRSEILGQSPSDDIIVELQAQILQDLLVKEVLSWQQPDGWLAWDFHGGKSIETGIRILCEKGVRSDHPALAKALAALEEHTERLDRGIGKVGKILDERGFGGSLMIRAAVFAYAGLERRPFLQGQIAQALAGFQALLAVGSIAEITEKYREKRVFRPGVCWPGIYHLRLLAFTQTWRTPENLQMVAGAIRRLVELSPLPDIGVRHKSQVMAPPSFAMHDFNPDMSQMSDSDWMMWFHRMECLARLGVIRLVPELQEQTAVLAGMLDAKGWFARKLSHPYFNQWGAYTGLMLENNWQSSQRRMNDLTFRSNLILHYG